MKAKRFFNALLASVMLAATAGLMAACSIHDDNPVSPDNVINNQWGNQELTFMVGSAGVKVKKVDGGDYTIQYVHDNEKRTVKGELTDFYIAPVEVTNKLWAAVMGSKPEGQTNDGDMYPVTNVSYEDITKEGGFLDKLNEMVAAQMPADVKFQLPTEAQWHYAAMGGQKSQGYTYAGSNTLDDVAWYKDNADGTTHIVGQKQPNELGLYDMTGNAGEWCYDKWYTTKYLLQEQGRNYAGTTSGSDRVLSGGGWDYGSESCLLSYRSFDTADKKANSLAFRLAVARVAQNSAYKCGDDLVYSYEKETKSLIISGTGDFYDIDHWANYGRPWQWLDDVERIVIQPGVTSVGYHIFQGMRSATSISIPNTVTFISRFAFSDCNILPSVVIPSSVTTIEPEAFSSCKDLETVTLQEGVKTLADSAFFDCRKLVSINIPASVTHIGKNAFAWTFRGESSITVDAGNSVYDSRNNCNAIIETATNTLLRGCQNTVIPNDITTIGVGAFSSCNEMTSVDIPASVTSIGEDAFYSCYKLVSIAIPASVSSIGSGAFRSCSELTSLNIPYGVAAIGDETFWNCRKLERVVIPASVASVGEKVFDSCYKLEDLYCYAVEPPTATDLSVPSWMYSEIILHVPAASVEAYKAATGWSKFQNIVALTDDDPKPVGM